MSDVIRKVAWMHVVDRRLLCVRTAGRKLFYMPGGKPEAGEDDVSALLREIAEELGVALTPPTINRVGRFSALADGNSGKTLVLEAYRAEYFGTLSSGFEIAEHRFLTSADAEMASAVTQEVIGYLKARKQID